MTIKTMWLSNAPWCNSAYAKIAREIIYRLHEIGYDQAITCNFGLEGGILNFPIVEGRPFVPHYPGGINHSQKALISHAEHFGANLLIVNYDIWPLKEIGKAAYHKGIGLVWYCPLDTMELNLANEERIKEAQYTLTMSRHAENEIKKAGYTNVQCITPGVNTKLYRPLTSNTDKQELRNVLGFDNYDYLIGIVKMNKDFTRSGLASQLQACKILKENLSDLKIGIYMHTSISGPTGAFHLPEVLANLQFKEEDVRFPDQYKYFIGYEEEEMAKIYNAFDVLCYGTYGEGFGMGVIEAHACGVPVVAPAHTSLYELLEVTPELRVPVPFNMWSPVPGKMATYDPYQLADKLELALIRGQDHYESIVRKSALRYDWQESIFPQWVKFYEMIPELLERFCLKPPKVSDELTKRLQKISIYNFGGK